MSNIQTPKKVYTASSHVNTSCCRLCKSVGDISHSKNLFAKNNRALLATVEELYGGSLSQNELLLLFSLSLSLTLRGRKKRDPGNEVVKGGAY